MNAVNSTVTILAPLCPPFPRPPRAPILPCIAPLTPLLLQAAVDEDPGLVGNLLVERMAGAHVHLVTKEEYGKHGSLVRACKGIAKGYSIFL